MRAFRTLAEFTKHIVPENTEPAVDPESMDEAAEVFGRQHRTFFTHADICSANIIMSQGRLAGIVDWEYAKCYPEHWEFTKGVNAMARDDVRRKNEAGLERTIRDAFDDDYADELRADTILQLSVPHTPFGLDMDMEE
ncbi:hypothetical protein BJX65DRAFT_282766 [Aspergillus insuetus]